MILVAGRSALRPEAEHDVGTPYAEEAHDLADERHRVDLSGRPGGVPRQLDVIDAEYPRGGGELAASNGAKLGARRSGDAGNLAGVPVSGAKEIATNNRRRV